MTDGDRVSFDIDGVIALLRSIADLVLSIFKPVNAAIVQIAGEGPTGFIVVFVIFFSLFLVRMSARSKSVDVFGHGVRYVGRTGLVATSLYLAVMIFNLVLMPIFVIAFQLVINTSLGMEPNFSQFFTLMDTPSNARSGFLSDFALFHFQERAILPLGFQASIIIFAAFGCMWLVGRAIAGRPATSVQG